MLPVAVHLPIGAAAPLPLIVVVHGRDGDPRSLRPLLDTWTAAGYVVAAPTFPVTRKDPDDKPEGEEVERQAGDVSFVIDELVEQSHDPRSPLSGSDRRRAHRRGRDVTRRDDGLRPHLEHVLPRPRA